MPPFPGDPAYRQLLAVHSTRNGVPLEDRVRDGTAEPDRPAAGEGQSVGVEPSAEDVPRETEPVEEPEAEPPPAAARRRR